MRWLVCGLIVVVVGCGGPSTTKLAPTSTIVVTLNGSPASGLTVRLVGTDGSNAGSGTTDGQGRAQIRGSSDQPVSPGTYKVTVIDAGEDEEDPMAVQVKKAKNRVPANYGKANSTPLSVTIEDGKTEYSIDVKTSR